MQNHESKFLKVPLIKEVKKLLFKTNRPLVNISNELTDVSFFKVNIEQVEVDDIQQLDKHKIDVLPTFVLCKNGHAVETCKGKVLYLCRIT